MSTILISNSFPDQPILRQVPRSPRRWCNHTFVSASNGEVIDGWVVYDNLLEPQTERCFRRNTLLVTGEPPTLRNYRSPFVSQFAHVRTSHSTIRHPDSLRIHEAQPWHYGLYPSQSHGQVMDYDSLSQLAAPRKTKLLSVIASNKTTTEDHRQRLRFVEHLKQAFGDQVDVFGRGIRDVADKADAIWDYRYHVVLENDRSQYYMSEKLPDAFLGWSFPFYSGGPQAEKIFPAGSFVAIDPHNPSEAIARIQASIARGDAEARQAQIHEARHVVLDEINLFAILCRFYDQQSMIFGSYSRDSRRESPKPITLLPKKLAVRLVFQRFLRTIAAAA